jgi:hypothetical protein
MLSTKIRTAIIGLAATFGVAAAVGPFAPAASAHGNNNLHWEFCHQLKQEAEQEIEKYAKSGGTDVEAFHEAVEDVKIAEKSECNWAAAESTRINSLPTPTYAGTLNVTTPEVSTPESGTVSPVRSVTSTPTTALH